MRLNLHEGGAMNLLLMSSDSRGQIFNSDTSIKYADVLFNDNTLSVGNRKYVKSPVAEDGLNRLVNRTLFSGNYLFGERSIEFQENGHIVGLDSIIRYKVNLDYADAGMQYDKIFFQFKNEKEPRTYLYKFFADTLVLYNINCLTLDEEYNYCLEVEKGSEFMRIIKNTKL